MAVTTFVPPVTNRGRKRWAPNDDDLKTATEAVLASQWILIEEVAPSYKSAGKYVRGWKAALENATGQEIRSMTFAADARTGEARPDITRDDEQRDGIVWRVGLALASTPQA